MIGNELQAKKVSIKHIVIFCIFSYKMLFKKFPVSTVYNSFYTFVTGFTAIVNGFLLRQIINNAVNFYNGDKSSANSIILYAAIICLFNIYLVVNSSMGEYSGEKLSYFSWIQSYDYVFEKIRDINTLSFKNNDFKAHLGESFSNYNYKFFISTIEGLLSSLYGFIGAILLLWTVSPIITGITIIICMMNFIKSYFLSKVLVDNKLDIEKKKKVNTYYSSLFNNKNSIKELKIFKFTGFITNRILKFGNQVINESILVAKKEKSLNFLLSLLLNIMQLFILLYLIYNIYLNRNTAGDIALYTSITISFSGIISLIGYYLPNVFERYRKYQKYTSFMEDEKWKEPCPNYIECDKLEDSIESIRFENVCFKYKDNSEFVLKNLNFEFHKGEYIAIVGINGAGKTTLIKLITGIYAPTQGIIYYNNIPHYKIKMSNIRDKCSIIYQDFCRYALTIRENIMFGNEYNEDYLNYLSKKIKFNKIIDQYPQKWDTILRTDIYPENATDLSGGQWQKLSILRALYKKSSVFIMDEPSSSLDAGAEELLYEYVTDSCGSNIKIIISHQLVCIKDTNRIIVLDNGEIIESGTHYELINSNGKYKELFNNQAEKYLY